MAMKRITDIVKGGSSVILFLKLITIYKIVYFKKIGEEGGEGEGGRGPCPKSSMAMSLYKAISKVSRSKFL